ncbi:unnamed protein product [Rhizoctonia solani]|uniref:DUF6593 domain-containing protein n=1 Tax=Rhizoctonia solani TaxID=456999 RepID=A0A8H3H1G8_9AGAM|nr:unnamed protein product [Rhizoctonia solani]
MTTYTLSSNNPRCTVLTDPDGNIAYRISTPFTLKNITTTITRADESDIVAVIHWNLLDKNEITMNGMTQRVIDVFPRVKTMGRSRMYTASDGEKFTWKNSMKLYCVSELTGINIATYYKTLLPGFKGKRSTLDISPGAWHLSDALVVTWSIMEKEAQD